MNAFDRIIGYSSIKRELMQISDTLKDTEAYERLGVSAPRGLMLCGEPGVGKSLMAGALIEDSGRRVFTCRKDKPNGDFVKEIKKVFDSAAENAPSIVYLDDMDKFSNGDDDHPDAEEYVTVQSCIDETKDKQVFVLATVNNICCLPRSLRRAGRFDRIIRVEVPEGDDAIGIITHYIKNKKFADDIDALEVARIASGRSCAELETVINQAGINAGYERSDTITMKHFIDACMKTIFETEISDGEGGEDGEPAEDTLHIAYHEAGHAVISEVLHPGSVTLVAMHCSGSERSGFTHYYDMNRTSTLYTVQSRIIGSLGGAAAVEQKFGILDCGCGSDIDSAFRGAWDLVTNLCNCGFRLHSGGLKDSDRLRAEQEQAAADEVERYFRKAREILSLNRGLLERIASELARRSLLTSADIRQLKSECGIVPVVL